MQKVSRHGKEARTSKSHVHTSGATSYANKRTDFVESHGRHPSHLEFFKLTHTKIDGGFVDNTMSVQFLEEANAKVQEIVDNAPSSKSRLEIENNVFDNLMYEEGQPKIPIGFGRGVKPSAIFGVNGLLRNSGCDSSTSINNSMEMENMKATIATMKKESEATLASVKNENIELKTRLNQTNQILIKTLNALRTGKVNTAFLDAAQSVLGVADSQVASTSSGTHLD